MALVTDCTCSLCLPTLRPSPEPRWSGSSGSAASLLLQWQSEITLPPGTRGETARAVIWSREGVRDPAWGLVDLWSRERAGQVLEEDVA